MTIALYISAWWSSGTFLLCFWWTEELDLRLDDFIILLFGGLVFGPVFSAPFAIGSILKRIGSNKIVIFRKRGKYEY